jgi:hypothetical protein
MYMMCVYNLIGYTVCYAGATKVLLHPTPGANYCVVTGIITSCNIYICTNMKYIVPITY